jgi:phosphopantothenate-cysteine ligase
MSAGSTGETRKLPPLNVLITAGGTIAPLDDVRLLTNRSTGRFAAALAEACLARGAAVTYLATTPQTLGPLEEPKQRFDETLDPASLRQRMVARMAQSWNHRGELRRIDLKHGTVSDYADTLETLTTTGGPWDIILLAAAVSDYEPLPTEGKIASDAEEIVITLRRTPKVIRQVRPWVGPNTMLVGFKLTSRCNDPEMVAIATQACQVNQANLTIVNDQTSVAAGRHRVALVRPDGRALWFEPGDEMADAVIAAIFQLHQQQVNK